MTCRQMLDSCNAESIIMNVRKGTNVSMNLSRSLLNLQILLKLGRMLSEYPFEAETVRRLQTVRLRRLLIHAYRNFDFYRERMEDAGLNPFRFRELSELQKLPVLTEAEYRAFADQEYEKNRDQCSGYFFDSTSGTTGIKFRIVRSWQERAYMIAKYLRPLILNGLKWNDLTFRIIAPTRINKKKDSLLQHLGFFRRRLLPFDVSAEEMAEEFRSLQPDFFYANKQQLLMTAYCLLDRNLEFRRPRIYSAVADIIDENCRQLFSRAFGSDNFFETYGCNELGNLAFQLRGEEGMHFCHDTDILEIQSASGITHVDGGNCLITDLGIYSFPAIRFQLGDHLETRKDEGGVVKIKKIWGRLHDLIEWKDGSSTRFSEFFRVMERFSEQICQFQFIQDDWHSFRVLCVLSPGHEDNPLPRSRLAGKLVSDLRKTIRGEADFQVQFVPLIAAGKNGKVKMVIKKESRIPAQQ